MNRWLSRRQWLFCMEYVKSGNGTKAAIAAGYNEPGASVQAVRLLRNPLIRAEIDRLSEEYAREVGLTVAWVLERLRETVERGGRDSIRALELIGRYLGMWDGHAAADQRPRLPALDGEHTIDELEVARRRRAAMRGEPYP